MNDYVQTHAAFGLEMPKAFELKRTLISVTTDPEVARYYAGQSGRVYEAFISKADLLKQTLYGAGESEYLIRLGKKGFKWK